MYGDNINARNVSANRAACTVVAETGEIDNYWPALLSQPGRKDENIL